MTSERPENDKAGDRLEELRQLYEASPEDINAASDLAQYYADRGWYNQALDIYKKLLKKNADNYALLLDYGNVCFRRDDIDEAMSVFKTLTVIKPGRVEGWNNLGITQFKTGDHEAARDAFAHVLSLEEDNAGALLNMGNYYEEKGNVDQAEEMFKRATAARPDFADAWFNLGNTYVVKEDHEAARDAYLKALRYHPEFPSAHKNLGYAHEQMGELGKALENYDKAKSLNRADAGIYINTANVYMKLEEYAKAKQHYLSAVKLAPREMAGWMGLRHLALRKGDVESYVKATMAVLQRLEVEAIAESIATVRELKHFDKVDKMVSLVDKLGRKGDVLDAERLLAYQRSNKEQARTRSLLKRLSALTEPSEPIALCLAEYYLGEKEYEKSVGYAKRVKRMVLEANRILWQASIAKEEWDETEASVRSYLEQNPECFECWYFLARIKAGAGLDEEAEECLILALESGFSDMAAIDEDPQLRRIRGSSAAERLSESWEQYLSRKVQGKRKEAAS